MSKTPLGLASRYRVSPPSPPRRAPKKPMSTTSAPGQSRVLAALAAMDIETRTPLSVEAVNPWPAPPLHPLFRPATNAPPKKSSLQRITKTKEKLNTSTSAATTETVAVTTTAELPVYSYKTFTPPPKLHFTTTEADANKWVAELDQTGPLSVDFEWVVAFRKNGVRPISVVQIADKRHIVVIQLRTSKSTMARFPLALQQLLEDPDVPKAGANILNDAKKLFKDYGVMMRGLVELGALARLADPTTKEVWGGGRKVIALAKLVERYLGKKLEKDDDVRIGNWEHPALEKNERQIEYAANDAYCGFQVYAHLLALAKTNEITVDATSLAVQHHHACLAPPLPSSDPAPERVPMIIFTPDMEAAGVAPQHLRAYRHWALGQRDIDTMCAELALRREPGAGALARGTVVTYVVSAVKNWPKLQYDLGKLRLLIQTDLRSWERHYEWVAGVASL
ncbi:nuclear transport factor 2 [Favolaschia claudopus]|uniref:Nuclear transport factor 2 n=1 Tax=Favolaschia claudopus TaxID=2862362 RepID=A0AAW0C1W0_9AGAR